MKFYIIFILVSFFLFSTGELLAKNSSKISTDLKVTKTNEMLVIAPQITTSTHASFIYKLTVKTKGSSGTSSISQSGFADIQPKAIHTLGQVSISIQNKTVYDIDLKLYQKGELIREIKVRYPK